MSAEPDREQSLLAAVEDGDKSAFVQLLRLHEDTVRAVAYSVTRNAELMEDVMQEAYIKAFRNIAKRNRDASFRAWLCQIVRNTAIDELRKRSKITYLGDDQIAESPDHRADTSHTATVVTDVREALNELPEAQRTAVVLVDLQQVPYQEVASMLGVPQGTVATRVRQARIALRQMLSAHGEEE